MTQCHRTKKIWMSLKKQNLCQTEGHYKICNRNYRLEKNWMNSEGFFKCVLNMYDTFTISILYTEKCTYFGVIKASVCTHDCGDSRGPCCPPPTLYIKRAQWGCRATAGTQQRGEINIVLHHSASWKGPSAQPYSWGGIAITPEVAHNCSKKSNWFQLAQPSARYRLQWALQWQPSWHLRENVTWSSVENRGDSRFRKTPRKVMFFLLSLYTISKTVAVFMPYHRQFIALALVLNW